MNLPTNTGLFSQAVERLNNCMKSGKLRLKATAFVRERQFGAANILRLILYRIYKPLQLALDDYCELVKVAPMSKQAFSKARQQLNPDFVRGLLMTPPR